MKVLTPPRGMGAYTRGFAPWGGPDRAADYLAELGCQWAAVLVGFRPRDTERFIARFARPVVVWAWPGDMMPAASRDESLRSWGQTYPRMLDDARRLGARAVIADLEGGPRIGWAAQSPSYIDSACSTMRDLAHSHGLSFLATIVPQQRHRARIAVYADRVRVQTYHKSAPEYRLTSLKTTIGAKLEHDLAGPGWLRESRDAQASYLVSFERSGASLRAPCFWFDAGAAPRSSGVFAASAAFAARRGVWGT